MSDWVGIQTNGFAEVGKNVLALGKKIRGQVIKRALATTAKPIAARMEALCPPLGGKGATGALRASITYRVTELRKSGGSTFSAKIGPGVRSGRPRHDIKLKVVSRVSKKTGKKLKGKTVELAYAKLNTKGARSGKMTINTPTRTWHLIEYGFLHRRGKTVTRIPPHPFMRTAWAQQGGDAAVTRFVYALEQAFDELTGQ